MASAPFVEIHRTSFAYDSGRTILNEVSSRCTRGTSAIRRRKAVADATTRGVLAWCVAVLCTDFVLPALLFSTG